MTQIVRELWSLILIKIYVAALLVIALLLVATGARAHSWYEQACCAATHCREVPDGVVVNGDQGVRVESFGLLNYSDARLRWSRDMMDHICVIGGKLVCVYRRPLMD